MTMTVIHTLEGQTPRLAVQVASQTQPQSELLGLDQATRVESVGTFYFLSRFVYPWAIKYDPQHHAQPAKHGCIVTESCVSQYAR